MDAGTALVGVALYDLRSYCSARSVPTAAMRSSRHGRAPLWLRWLRRLPPLGAPACGEFYAACYVGGVRHAAWIAVRSERLHHTGGACCSLGHKSSSRSVAHFPIACAAALTSANAPSRSSPQRRPRKAARADPKTTRRSGGAGVVRRLEKGHRPRARLAEELPRTISNDPRASRPSGRNISNVSAALIVLQIQRASKRLNRRITPVKGHHTRASGRHALRGPLHGPWFGIVRGFALRGARVRAHRPVDGGECTSASVAGILRGDTSGVDSDSSTPDIGDVARRRRASRSARASREELLQLLREEVVGAVEDARALL